MGTRTIDRKVMSTLSLRRIRFDRCAPLPLNIRNTFDIFPHFINDYRTNQRVLDGAREQEWRCILYQIAHDRRFTAIARIDITMPFRHYVLCAGSIHSLLKRLHQMFWLKSKS